MQVELPINYDSATWQERRRAREAYVVKQEYNCCLCGKPLNVRPIVEQRLNKSLFPKNFFEWPVHLHHNHQTGMTIGAVHAYCNAVSWQYYGE